MNSLEHPDREKKTILEKVREIPSALLITLGLAITTLSLMEGFNVHEYVQLKNKKEIMRKKVEEKDPHHSYQKVVELYGPVLKDELNDLDNKATMDFENLEGSLDYLKDLDNRAEQFDWSQGGLTPRKVEFFHERTEELSQKGREVVIPRIAELPSLSESHERKSNMDYAFIAGVLTKTFPKNWGFSEVSMIRYENRKSPMPESYEIKSGSDESWAQFDRQESVVTFFRPVEKYSISQNINDALAHELGHANDWLSDNETSIADRMDLLVALADRIESDDRYVSDYVESIGMPDRHSGEVTYGETYVRQIQRYNKVTEYWGEICSAYFSNPHLLNIKDFELVDNWVKKNDPSFNLARSITLRNQMMQEYANK